MSSSLEKEEQDDVVAEAKAGAKSTPETSLRKATTRRGRAIGRQLLRVVLGLVCGAAIAECGFHLRDDGAFPHLNIYDFDAALGVRLRPNAKQRIAFGGNPVTSIRIGDEGLRGDVPRSKGNEEEILVVGDSQVFGLGVEETETFSSRLAQKQKDRVVINAGIPTYGPLEYQAVIDTWIAKRKPRVTTVIYVINLANDLLEAKRPNLTRHAVWDGWAVRKETAPSSVTQFPGRQLLFRDSHAVFWFRRVLHGSSKDDARPLPSEGTFTDLLDAANASTQAHDSSDQQALEEWLKAMKDAEGEATASQTKLETTAAAAYPDVFSDRAGKDYLRTHGHPGDIVSERVRLSEATEGPIDRVQVVLQGAKIRQSIERSLKERAEAEIEKQEAKAILAGFEERTQIEKKIAQLRTLPTKLARAYSPMAGPIEQAHAACKKNNARLFVVVLPMDVQVSPDEWKKYGEGFADMAPAQVLGDDIVHVTEALGVPVLDATPALAAAEPGAFLNADLHMTPKGHQALADAIHTKLAEPPKAIAAGAPGGPALGFSRVCKCELSVHARAGSSTNSPAAGSTTKSVCDSLPPKPDVDCLRTYADDCTKLLACVRGVGGAAPKCLEGWKNANDQNRCFRTCDEGDPCAVGTCTKTKTGQVCL